MPAMVCREKASIRRDSHVVGPAGIKPGHRLQYSAAERQGNDASLGVVILQGMAAAVKRPERRRLGVTAGETATF